MTEPREASEAKPSPQDGDEAADAIVNASDGASASAASPHEEDRDDPAEMPDSPDDFEFVVDPTIETPAEITTSKAVVKAGPVPAPQGPPQGSASFLSRKPLSFRNPLTTYYKSLEALVGEEGHGAQTHLRRMVLSEGGLAKSNQVFRPVIWALFLELLPPNVDDWPGLMQSRRETYELDRREYTCDKRHSADLSPQVNNPLSQDSESPWQKYFEDRKLIDSIIGDVNRTYQEDPFFRTSVVRTMMNTILFVYAKKYPQLSYKQGMSDLLGNILQLQYDTCQEYEKMYKGHAREANVTQVSLAVRRACDVINDMQFLEHDTFHLFEKFMDRMWDWYYVSEENLCRDKDGPNDRTLSLDAKLFQDKNIFHFSIASRRLQNIWENVLQLHDRHLFSHLQNMDVIPTTFGTNWTKLLFCRQFQDYLPVWDAVLATDFSLVDYIVVAMILAIRNLLLGGSSNECNMLLVSQYPSSIDVRYIIAKALHIQEPLKYPDPSGSPFKLSLPYFQDKKKRISVTKSQKEDIGHGSQVKRNTRDGRKNKLFILNKVQVGEVPIIEQKMVDLSGPQPYEHKVFSCESNWNESEFLKGEPSYMPMLSADINLAQISGWRRDLKQSLTLLTSQISSSQSLTTNAEVRESLAVISSVIDRMTAAVSHLQQLGLEAQQGDQQPTMGVDALELSGGAAIDS